MTATPRSGIGTATLAIAGALLVGGVSTAAAATSTTAVRFRFSENERTGTAPISGTYTVEGAITDHGTAKGTHFPIYKTVNGVRVIAGIELIQTQHGAHGSFTMDCRDTHFESDKQGQITKATGRCVFTHATGPYTRLAPVGSSVLIPTHPRKGYTHTVRRVRGRTR